jgi:tRNA nucleotidyltransferase (CCA-adding enzyme)
MSTGILKRYAAFLTTCKNLDILEVYNLKPLIDGKALAKAMNIAPGPWMKDALNVVVAWQLRNPNANDVDEVIKEVGYHLDNSSDAEPSRKKPKHGELTSALIDYFLHETLRLIFFQRRRPDLTDTGRRNINAHSDTRSSALFDDSPRPWLKEKWSQDLLLWVCKNLSSDTVEKKWGVLIPPVLTLVDEVDIPVKAKGCECLGYLLSKTSAPLLQRTGLHPEFEESLFMAAALLPTLTPEPDSVIIINAAYPALLALANATPAESSKPNDPTRIKVLLKILRQGFLTAMGHAGEHVRVANALVDQLPPILDNLGIDSVIHLKDLAPMLAAILNNPLGTTFPPLLLSALKAEQALIRNAWPRAWYWRGDLLKGPCGIWVRMAEDEKESGSNAEFKTVRVECKETVEMLNATISVSEVKDNWSSETKALIEAEGLLESLLKTPPC